MDLLQILQKTLSPDKNELVCAQQFLEEAAKNNPLEFIKSLTEVLTNPTNPGPCRVAAGLQIKNQLTSKDPETKRLYQQRWLTFPVDQRNIIKQNCLSCFGTETERPSAAAQVVAYVAIAELPHDQWPELMRILVNNVANANSTEMIKVVTLETIGYICLEIEPIEVLAARSNEILTVIVHCMRRDETSDRVKLAATNALQNSLEFSKSNFNNDNERHYIMQVICETTQSTNVQVRVAALQCLVKIMSLYYEFMEHYMAPALFAISMEAIKSDVDEIALQGIEFWSNVCEEEIDLSIELSEATEEGHPPARLSMYYAKGAVQFLMPLLTQCLMKQEEHDDEDEWNVCKAAGVCLMLLATCCEDTIIPHALPFIQENIKHTDWRRRDAAVMLFGSILEGAETNSTKSLADTAMGALISMLNDTSVVVRDTTAWTIGRVCENASAAALSPQYLPALLQELSKGLSMEPRVAANVCWALSSLAQAAYEEAQMGDSNRTPETYALSPYFESLIKKLLEASERADGMQSNLRGAAYEALMEMMKNSPNDCYPWVQNMTMIILQRIQTILEHSQVAITGSPQEKNAFYDLQCLLCATLTSLLRKMTAEDAPKVSDIIMAALLEMFKTTVGLKESGVQEDALMAVSTLIEVLGRNFLKYMESFRPYLVLGLQNHQETQVCLAAVGVCADLCRSMGTDMIPYCDEIMTLLLGALNDVALNRNVKPQILSTFGDIALAIGPGIQKYAEVMLTTLSKASQAHVDRSDFENVEYLNELRNGCLDAYTGILQGLRGENQNTSNLLQLLAPHVEFIVRFIMSIAQDNEKNDSLVGTSAGLIFDLVTTFGREIIPLVDNDVINELLTEGRRSRVSKTKTMALYATKEIRKIKNLNCQV